MPAYRQGDEKRRGELSWAPGLSALAGLAQQVPRRRFPLREAGEVVKAREAPRSLCPPRAQCLGDEERWQAEERLQGADIIDLVLTSTARILVNATADSHGEGQGEIRPFEGAGFRNPLLPSHRSGSSTPGVWPVRLSDERGMNLLRALGEAGEAGRVQAALLTGRSLLRLSFRSIGKSW